MQARGRAAHARGSGLLASRVRQSWHVRRHLAVRSAAAGRCARRWRRCGGRLCARATFCRRDAERILRVWVVLVCGGERPPHLAGRRNASWCADARQPWRRRRPSQQRDELRQAPAPAEPARAEPSRLLRHPPAATAGRCFRRLDGCRSGRGGTPSCAAAQLGRGQPLHARGCRCHGAARPQGALLLFQGLLLLVQTALARCSDGSTPFEAAARLVLARCRRARCRRFGCCRFYCRLRRRAFPPRQPRRARRRAGEEGDGGQCGGAFAAASGLRPRFARCMHTRAGCASGGRRLGVLGVEPATSSASRDSLLGERLPRRGGPAAGGRR